MSEAERKHQLAVILVADAVGYTRLMAANADSTLTALDAARQVFKQNIDANGGRVVDMAGDSVLAVFSTASGAAQAACAIQDQLAGMQAARDAPGKLRFRIGLNLGEVLEKADGSVYGDGVNIAARLESLADPGAVMVSASVYGALTDGLARPFASAGEHRVKHVGRPLIAYQRAAPDKATQARETAMDAATARQPAPAASAGSGQPVARRRRWRYVLLAPVLIAAAVFLVRTVYIERNVLVPVEQMPLALPDKPSVAVLPLVNDLGSDERAFLADGLTADLIADLAKVSGLFVIGPHSSFAYRNRDVTVADFARDLSVRYVVRGEVTTEDTGPSADVRLVDVVDGNLLWREDFDLSPANTVNATSAMARRIVNSLGVNLTRAEAGSHLVPGTLEPQAFEQGVFGRALFVRQTPQALARAVPHLERAIAADPAYAMPYAVLAALYWQSLRQGWHEALGLDRDALRSKVLTYRDLVLQRPTPRGLIVASDIHLWDGEHARAEALVAQATVLAPNNAQVKLKLAEILAFAGEYERALRNQREASRLDPYDRARQAYVAGVAQFGLGQYQLASESLSSALDLDPSAGRPAVFAAAANGFLDRRDQAADVLAPYLTSGWMKGDPNTIASQFPFRRAADAQRLADGLTRAGIAAR